MLVTLPDYDMTTHYLSVWGRKSINAAEEHNIQVTTLEKEKVNRKNVESYLSGFKFNVVFLNGHGSPQLVTGHLEEPVIILGKNEAALKGTITYAVSCSSAKELGDSTILAGARCYVGYTEDFIFVLDDNNSTHPSEDKLAGLFLEHTYVFMNGLFRGASVGDAYEKARESLWSSISIAESSGNKGILSWLVWDYYAFVLKGDGSAML